MTVRIAIAFFGALLFADIASAQTCGPYTYSFTSGTSAVAAQVNANFSTILTCFNNLASGSYSLAGPVGIDTPMPTNILDITQNQNAQSYPTVLNSNAGGSAASGWRATNGTNTAIFGMWGTGASSSGTLVPGAGFMFAAGAPGLTLQAASGPITFAAGGSAEIARFASNGSFTMGGYTGSGGFTANGQSAFAAAATGGLQIFGRGSTDDIEVYNKSAQLVATVPTGTTNFNVVGNLDVGGAEFITGTLALGAASGNNGWEGLGGATVNGAVLSGQGSSFDVYIGNKTSAMAIGVPTGTTTVQLPSLAGSGNRMVYSDASGNLTNSSSDARLKANIAFLTNGLSEVEMLKPVAFNWRADLQPKMGSQREIGFLAQNVQRAVPEVVGTNSDGTLSVDYPKLVAVLTSAIQDQQKEIDALKACRLWCMIKQAIAL